MGVLLNSNDDDTNMTSVGLHNVNVLFIWLVGSRKHPLHPSGLCSTADPLYPGGSLLFSRFI